MNGLGSFDDITGGNADGGDGGSIGSGTEVQTGFGGVGASTKKGF